jgi:hypothetical protein
MTRIEKIASLYSALTGDADVSSAELHQYAGLSESVTLESISATLTSGSVLNFSAMPVNDMLNYMFINLFGYTQAEVDALRATEAGAAGFQYWVDELANNPEMINVNTIAIALLNGAGAADDAAAATKVASVVTTYEADYPDGGSSEPSVPGETYVLTEGRDNVSGTDDDDTIYGDVGQNDLGAVSNALDSGDVINGGAGHDTIVATLINGNEVDGANATEAPMPRVDSVEELRIQAMEEVTLDANHVTGENHYASEDSRDDLTITNIDITSTQITNDIVFEMKDTQQFSDMEVYFNEQDLKAAPDQTSSNSEFFIQVADGIATQEAPLENLQFDLSFTQGTDTYTFEGITSTDGTYEGLVSALQVAFAQQGLADYTVSLGNEFTEVYYLDEAGNVTNTIPLLNGRTGFYINVSDDEGESFDSIEFRPAAKAGADAVQILAESAIEQDSSVTTYQVESTVIFDNVGRGSNGGEFIVGSTSASNTSTGVEVINVIVENSSVVSDISSTNNALKEITLTNGTVKGDFILANSDFDAGDNDNAYDNVDQANLLKEGLTSITATDFDGDIVLGRDAAIVDLGTLSASVNGDVTYNADLNDGSYKSVTGAGDDTINMALDAAAVIISTGNGTNTVTLDEDGAASTADITGGSGVDTIYGQNAAIAVDAGNGDDVIYAENTGGKAVLSFATSSLTDPVAATEANGGEATIGEYEWLHMSQVQVTLTTAGTAADEYDLGLESALVAIEGSAANGYLTTKADINTAILKAINEDATLSKIASASVDDSGDVLVTYKVDGAQLATSLEVKFYAPETTLSTTVTNAAIAAWEDKYHESDEFPTDTADYATAQTAALAAANAVVESVYGGPEQQTFTITADDVDNGDETITIGTQTWNDFAVDVTAATATAADIATDLDGTDIDGDGNADAVAAAGNVVTVTYFDTGADVVQQASVVDGTTNGLAVADATSVDYVARSAGTDAVNSGSNSVNGGAGDDVIVLSSDAAATDSVVLTNYNQGTDTIIHFDSGSDTLNLSAYLTNTITPNPGSASEASQVQFTSAIAGDAGVHFTANSVTVTTFTDAGFNGLLDTAQDTAEFATLTAAEVEAALEDATSSFDTTINNDLYGTQAAKSILIIENDEQDFADGTEVSNLDEYMVFEVSYDNATVAANAADKDFTVKLVGTLDMEDANSLAATDVLS